jgi:hypothetical protein
LFHLPYEFEFPTDLLFRRLSLFSAVYMARIAVTLVSADIVHPVVLSLAAGI